MRNDDSPPASPNDGFMMLVAERLARIEATLESIRRDRDEMLKERDDHEGRLRSLERWKYMLPSSFVAAIISAAVALYGQLGR